MVMSISSLGLPYHSYRIYDVTFFEDEIKTLVTDTPCIVSTWLSDMERLHERRLDHLVVGLDIEWRPSFSSSPNPPATLQLCIGRNCLIFQILIAPEIPPTLRYFLLNQDYTFVGIGIENDIQKLYDQYGIQVANTVDLRKLAAEEEGKWFLRSAGLVTLSSEVLGKNFEKRKDVTMSNWDDDWLSQEQIQYACVDAFVSFEIGRCLKASVN